ncbi:hypothetical protein HMPREF9192_1551 [Streptococcus vestibularis F0396]|uniref:Uncharacterized protein n=1 Tax=Streptococcus vestibularis F0396 TaxID=904306 RepID=E3CNT8_STRVE|nr:hypothetical protein HMPREF9192_1551 [Streptococcus vestibularis F0396]
MRTAMTLTVSNNNKYGSKKDLRDILKALHKQMYSSHC